MKPKLLLLTLRLALLFSTLFSCVAFGAPPRTDNGAGKRAKQILEGGL
jgi:hypothetical protein